jgi:hypothetical protein
LDCGEWCLQVRVLLQPHHRVVHSVFQLGGPPQCGESAGPMRCVAVQCRLRCCGVRLESVRRVRRWQVQACRLRAMHALSPRHHCDRGSGPVFGLPRGEVCRRSGERVRVVRGAQLGACPELQPRQLHLQRWLHWAGRRPMQALYTWVLQVGGGLWRMCGVPAGALRARQRILNVRGLCRQHLCAGAVGCNGVL